MAKGYHNPVSCEMFKGEEVEKVLETAQKNRFFSIHE
jgi:hypothetical protein